MISCTTVLTCTSHAWLICLPTFTIIVHDQLEHFGALSLGSVVIHQVHTHTVILCNVILCVSVYMYTLSLCGTSMHITHLSISVHSSHLQVTPPESVRGRCDHSITATSLGPGLTEVLMFGGEVEGLSGDLIAETIILRFGEGVDTVHALPLAVPYVATGLLLWRMKFLV